MRNGNSWMRMTAIAVLTLTHAAMTVQARDWVAPVGTTNDWNTAGNWAGTLVPSNEIANVSNQGTAQIGANAPYVTELWAGNNGGTGAVLQTAGSIMVSNWLVMARNGGGQPNGVGDYTMTGGTLNHGGNGNFYLGDNNANAVATMTVGGSATVNSLGGIMLIGSGPARGTLTIKDQATFTKGASDLYVGTGSGGGTLNILGGTFNTTNSSWTAVGRYDNAVGVMAVSNAAWNRVGGDFNVGVDGSTTYAKGTVTLAGTSVVNWASSALYLGAKGTNDNTFTVKDQVVFSKNGGNFVVGSSGSGTLNLFGGTFNQTNDWSAVGRYDNGVGVMVVSNAVWNRYGQDFNVGVDGTIHNAKGAVTLVGTSVVNWASSTLNIGQSTNDNTFAIKDSAALVMIGSEVDIGRWGFTPVSTWLPYKGTLNISGGSLYCRTFFGISRDGGMGVVNLSGGTLTKDNGGDRFSIGNQGSGNNGTLNQTGGNLVINANLDMASDRSVATYNFSGGTATVWNLDIGYGSNAVAAVNLSGSANLTAASISMGNIAGAATGVTNGLFNLDGGTVTANGFVRGGSVDPVLLNLNGGLLRGRQANANFLSGFRAGEVNLKAGGGFFDCGGYAITLANGLPGVGGLALQGSGTLTLSGTNTYGGGTTVNGGLLVFANTNAIPASGTIKVNTGAALNYSFTNILALLNDPRVTFNGGAAAMAAADANTAIDLSGAAFTNAFITSLGNLTYTGTLTPNGGTYRLGGGSGTLTYSPAITGAVNLIVASGVTLTGANTYGGGTLITSSGRLQGNTASLPNSGGMTNNGTLVFDQAANATFSDVISGSGAVIKQNTGTLTLSGANSYAGPTTLNAGNLQITADNNLGGAPGTPTVGSLILNGVNAANGGIQWNGTVTTAGDALLVNGTFALNVNRGITVGNVLGEINVSGANTLTYGGTITNSTGSPSALLKSGTGTLVLSGNNAANGGLWVNGGVLQLAGANALVSNPLMVGAGLASVVDLNGFSQTVSALSGGAGGTITNSSATPVTLTVGAGNAAGTFGAAIKQGAGIVSFTKTGTGLLNLNSASGANTYSGATTISNGTLRLVGATEKWVADSLAGGTGATVSNWTGSLQSRPAVTYTAAPTLTTNALNGHSVVSFNGSQNLQVLAANSPMSNANDFTLALVFRPTAAGIGTDGAWYGNTGLLDSEQGGDQEDWGFAWNSLLHVGAGRGGNDTTLWSSSVSASNVTHVALYSKSGNTTTLMVDGAIYSQTAGGSSMRNINMFAIGSASGGGNKFTGDMAEIQVYNTALSGVALSNAWLRMAYTYGLTNTFAPLAVDLIPDSSVLNVASNAVFDLNGQSETVAGLSGAAGSGVTLGAGMLTLGGTAAPQAFAGSISGSGGLLKNGAGEQTLSGVNTYSGATTVTGGTLLAGGSLAGAVTVGTNTTFGVAGTAGALAIGGGLTLNGALLADVAMNGTSDVVNVTGNLVLGSNSTLQIADTNLLNPAKTKYLIATYTGTLSGKFKSSNLPSGRVIHYDKVTKQIYVGPPTGSMILVF